MVALKLNSEHFLKFMQFHDSTKSDWILFLFKIWEIVILINEFAKKNFLTNVH